MKDKHFNSEEQNKVICQRIRDNIPIQDYAAARGFEIVKKGSFYGIKGRSKTADFSSVLIKPSTNRYCRFANEHRWHSIIDFVQELDNCDTAAAINKLKPLIDTYDLDKAVISKPYQARNTHKKNLELELPERADTTKNVYAYLNRTRHINCDVIDNFIWNNNLYQDRHNNCVFVSYDRQGKATFCNKRGTNTFAKNRFMWEHPDNDYNHCFFINNGSSTLIVNEGVIDSMSVMSIMQDCGRELNSYDYVALGGSGKWEAVSNILRENPNIQNLVLACDNDDAGFTAMENIRKAAEENFPDVKITHFLPKTENDWNEQLTMIRKHGISASEYLRESPGKLISINAVIQPLHLYQQKEAAGLELSKAGAFL